MKKADLLFFTKGPNLFTQFSDAAQSIEALRLNQELELTIGNAFVWFCHEKRWVVDCVYKIAMPLHSSIARAYLKKEVVVVFTRNSYINQLFTDS